MESQKAGDRLKRFGEPSVEPDQDGTDPVLLFASLRERCTEITDKIPKGLDWSHIKSADILSDQAVDPHLEDEIYRKIDLLKETPIKKVKTDDGTEVSVVRKLRPPSRSSDNDISQSEIGLSLKNPVLKVGIIAFLPRSRQESVNFNLQVFFDPGSEDQRKFMGANPMANLRQEEAVIIDYCLSRFLEGEELNDH